MTRTLSGTAVALVGVLALAASVFAAGTSKTISGNSGTAANFTTVNGCTSNDITVRTNFIFTLLHKRGEGAIGTEFTIESRDACSGQDLGTSLGNGDPARIAFTGDDLNGASLTGTIQVVDPSGTPRTVSVSLAWTGVGTIKRTNTTTRIVTGNVTTTSHTKNTSRSATVTGSVDDLPVDSADGMLFKDTIVTQTH